MFVITPVGATKAPAASTPLFCDAEADLAPRVFHLRGKSEDDGHRDDEDDPTHHSSTTVWFASKISASHG